MAIQAILALLVLLAFGIAACSRPLFAQQVIATVPTGTAPTAIATSQASNKIYVANQSSNNVTVIDGSNNSTTGVSVGGEPDAIALNPSTNKIYVANEYDYSVTVIDGATNNTTTVGVYSVPYAIAINPVTNKIYVATPIRAVTVIDGDTNDTTVVFVGNYPTTIAVNPVTNKVYVGNLLDGTVTVIDGATNNTATVSVGNGPCAIAVNALTNKIYVANQDDYTVTVIDGSTNRTTTVPAGPFPAALAVNRVTNQIYVADSGGDTVTVIDGASNDTTTVNVGNGPVAIAVDAATNKTYVANSGSDTVTMIDGATNGTTTLNVGSFPYAIAVNQATNRVYDVNLVDNDVSVIAGAGTSPVQFIPVTPCRVADTRDSGGPIEGGSSRDFSVPQSPCGIPASAAAFSMNVTVVPSGSLGYLTIWPTGEDQPAVSTMNSLDGRIKANAAIVPAGYEGTVSVYVSNLTNVVLDIDGYFAPASGSTLQYYPLTPCRVLDTRNANGDLGGPYLQGGQERDFPVLESSCIPQGITPQAYSMNFTVVPVGGQPLGYLTVWPQGSQRPLVSTLNNPTATIVANAAIVPAGTGGGIAAFADQNTQLVADIDGYFAASGPGGLSLYPAAPCRVIDTRKGSGAFSGELTVDVVDSVCAPPSSTQAYVFNATVVPTGSLGYLTLWPDSEQRPTVSTLNAIDGAITSNMAIVPNLNGKTDAFASGITQLIVDISSFFAP